MGGASIRQGGGREQGTGSTLNRQSSIANRQFHPPPFPKPGPPTTFRLRMPTRTTLLDDRAIARALARMASEIVERCHGTETLVLVGIQRRGVELAERLARLIEGLEGRPIPCGKLDITLYRDDLQAIGGRPAGGRRDRPPGGPRRPHRGDRGRRALHRPDHARGAGRAGRLRPAPADPALRADRPRAAGSCRSSPTSSACSSAAPAPTTGWTCCVKELDGATRWSWRGAA